VVRGDDYSLYSEAMPQKLGQNGRDKAAQVNRGLAAILKKRAEMVLLKT
jgi:hypothetical protein